MLRLKVLYPMICFLVLAAFNVFYWYGKVPYHFINLILFLSLPVGFIYKKSIAAGFAVLLWALPFVFMFIYKIDMVNAFFPFVLFSFAFIGSILYKNEVNAVIKRYELQTKEREDSVHIYSRELEELYEKEKETRDRELAVVKLYEITKKMSEDLKFDDIVNVFGVLLRENFIFKRCELVILKQPDADLSAEKSYKILPDENSKDKNSEIDMEEVVSYFLHEGSKEIYATRKEDSTFFVRFGIRDDVRTIAAIPLLSEKKMVGALVMEDLPAIDLERVVIMSMQFALEIKKVLLYEKVEELAITDGLTGVYVRRYFLERFNEELKRSQRYDFNFAFLMIDIDNFKKRNDTYGHLVGDVILKEIARILKESVREIDLVSRYGGEEFSILLPETDRTGAKLVAERIRERISANVFKAYDEKLNLTVSIGVSVYPEDTDDWKELIEHADAALYVAKRSGKNVVCEYKK